MTIDELQRRIGELQRRLESLAGELAGLRAAMLTSDGSAVAYPLVPRSVLDGPHHRLTVQITADNQDGTYQAKRKVALGTNVFADDPEHSQTLTVGNLAEMYAYQGLLSVGEILVAYFDGLGAADTPLYHLRST